MKRIVLTQEQTRRFEDAVYAEYNAMGSEFENLSRATFVLIMADRLASGAQNARRPFARDETALWLSLSARQQRDICLAVGP